MKPEDRKRARQLLNALSQQYKWASVASYKDSIVINGRYRNNGKHFVIARFDNQDLKHIDINLDDAALEIIAKWVAVKQKERKQHELSQAE